MGEFLTSEADRRARSYGYDRRGPGGACTCQWSSRSHGDECPEHGAAGTPIPAEIDAWRDRAAALEAERDAAWERSIDEGKVRDALHAAERRLNRRSAEERCRDDPVFAQLVNVIQQSIESLDLTPSEVRDAAMLAAIRSELSSVRATLPLPASAEAVAAPPEAGTRARCRDCGRPITFDGRVWSHDGTPTPRHPAQPEARGRPPG